jgi:hypothetical protein
MKEAFRTNGPQFIDFDQGNKHPLAVVQELMTKAMKELAAERANDYQVEHPLDGALLSLQLWGFYSKGFTGVTAWALQCGDQNPLVWELQAIKGHVESIVIRD